MMTTMRRRSKVRGLAAWLGLTPDAVELGDNVVVISPHLDDAVFSLGAAVARAARRGARVRILTVLAGDPRSQLAAGPWDFETGFRTAGEAARARREEDRRACALLGAVPLWLPHEDHQYERRVEDAVVRAQVVAAVGDATVLLPGFPLAHQDHAWLARLLDGAFERERVGYYVEQPYAVWAPDEPFDAVLTTGPRCWLRASADVRSRLRKLRACRAYGSQLAHLGEGTLLAICRREVLFGGELVAWARDAMSVERKPYD
jgi:LmbE family N-acetylglucosaminyl deacetylase